MLVQKIQTPILKHNIEYSLQFTVQYRCHNWGILLATNSKSD